MVASVLRKIIPKRYRPIGYLMHRAYSKSNGTTSVGPFAGMKYIDDSFGSCHINKILGIYEQEIHHAVEQAIAAKPKLIVDIGAAEGYYAVGLSRRLPDAKVIAYEMEEQGRRLLRRMIDLNSAGDRIEIRGKCEIADLKAALATEPGSALVVCDCEGYENILLDPAAIPQLTRAMILMESHDIFEPGTADRITGRFAATHEVERTWSVDRTPADFPYPSLVTRLLPAKYMKWAVSEWRPVLMSWLWMRPRVNEQ